MQQKDLRPLTHEEVDTLTQNACLAQDWQQVRVTDGFDAARVRYVCFEGAVTIGRLTGTVETGDGIQRDAALVRVTLRDVCIGDDCLITDVRGLLANLDIGDNVVVESVGTIACTGETTFGNGHEVSVLNEAGGRELKITAETSAQAAYLTVLYRDNAALIDKLNGLAEDTANRARRTRAAIGDGACITDCGRIVNVTIGPHARLNGALSLNEGTIVSSPEAPTTIGPGVVAEEFIVLQGASVTDGAMIASSLVGEAVRIGKQFSAENSVFFANSEGFHSEVCSLFAGPYSVTHHRSTLLIAALTSFYNAGSGTNQSNHMYKLGPLHQGILERGCKTGSFSYLLWPAKIGAFTAIIGKHYTHFDTSLFPFSYISEEEGKSVLVPAMNFFTVGTLRDGEKWPARDRRTGARNLDRIVFDVLSPFTAQKMLTAVGILEDLQKNTDRSEEYVTQGGIHIKRRLLKTCGRYYRLALDKYLGDVVMSRLEAQAGDDIPDVLKPEGDGRSGTGEWLDIGGLICCKDRLDRLISDVVSGTIDSMEALNDAFETVQASYEADAWNWCLQAYERQTGRSLFDEPAESLQAFLEKWKTSSLKLLNMVLGDAQKEFEGATRIGFGIDGNQDADFEAVRGDFDGNKFVRKLRDDTETINARYDKVAASIGRT
jgi:hypothetical protein